MAAELDSPGTEIRTVPLFWFIWKICSRSTTEI
jgi:hypothetical protein